MENLGVGSLKAKDEESCIRSFEQKVQATEGVKELQYSAAKGSLQVLVDKALPTKHYKQALNQAAGETLQKLARCKDRKGFRTCACCDIEVDRLQAQLAHFAKLKRLVFEGGHIRVQSTAEAKIAKDTRRIQEEKKSETNKYGLALLLTLVNAGFGLMAFSFGLFYGFHPLVIGLWVVSYLAGGYYGTLASLDSLRHKSLNIDFVMILAALGAAAIGRPAEGAILLFLFSFSNTLQSFAMDRSRKSIAKLVKLRPEVARVKVGNEIQEKPVQELILGELLVVRPGEAIPIDGEVAFGISEINQANLTGESLPVLRKKGDPVLAGTLNTTGYLEITVTKLASESTLAKVIHLVEDAWNNKASTQRWLEKFEVYYTGSILTITAGIIVFPYYYLGADLYPTFYKAINFLVIASPCALVISTPASIISAIANAALNGILFKGGGALEAAGRIDVLALDKTGTITLGSPKVSHVSAFFGSEEELLREIMPIERKSEHVVARAIAAYGQKFSTAHEPVDDFVAIYGMGVSGKVCLHHYLIGNAQLFQDMAIPIPPDLTHRADQLMKLAQTLIYIFRAPVSHRAETLSEKLPIPVAKSHPEARFIGLIALSDPVKADAALMVRQVRESGVKKVVLLTGDNVEVARQVSKQVGIDEFYANLLPQNKTEKIKELQKLYGRVAMLGDGVNDAPSLVAADLGIAMGEGGTDVAIDAADAVLMNNNLRKITHLFGLARYSRKIIIQNLTFAISVIVLLVGFNYFVGIPLPLGVVGHEGSTVLVIFNGMRLLVYGQGFWGELREKIRPRQALS